MTLLHRLPGLRIGHILAVIVLGVLLQLAHQGVLIARRQRLSTGRTLDVMLVLMLLVHFRPSFAKQLLNDVILHYR